MKVKLIYADCPYCGKNALIDKRSIEIITKRKSAVYVHIKCLEENRRGIRNDIKN